MAKLIVDTSIWIDFFNGKLPPHVSENLVVSLRQTLVSSTDIILHEILVGTKTKKEYKEFKELLSPLPVLQLEEKHLEDFNQFAWEVRKKGLSGKYTDINIAFLSKHHAQPILSWDRYFHRLQNAGFVQTIQII